MNTEQALEDLKNRMKTQKHDLTAVDMHNVLICLHEDCKENKSKGKILAKWLKALREATHK